MPLSEAQLRAAKTASLDDALNSSALCKSFYEHCKASHSQENLDFMHFAARLGGNGDLRPPRGIKPPGTPGLQKYKPAVRGKSGLVWLVEEFVVEGSPRQVNLRNEIAAQLKELTEKQDASGAYGGLLTGASFAAAYKEIHSMLSKDVFTRWKVVQAKELAKLEVARERAHQKTKLTKHSHGRFKLYNESADGSGELVFVSSTMLKAINRASEQTVKGSSAKLREGYWIRNRTAYTVGPPAAAEDFLKALQKSGVAGTVNPKSVLEVQQMAPEEVRNALRVKSPEDVSKEIDTELAASARAASSRPVSRTVKVADKVQTGRPTAVEGLEKGWEWLRLVLTKTGNDRILLRSLQQKLPQMIQKARSGALTKSDQDFRKIVEQGNGNYWSMIAYVDMNKPDLVSGQLELWLYRGTSKPSAQPSASAKDRWYNVWSFDETKAVFTLQQLQEIGLVG